MKMSAYRREHTVERKEYGGLELVLFKPFREQNVYRSLCASCTDVERDFVTGRCSSTKIFLSHVALVSPLATPRYSALALNT